MVRALGVVHDLVAELTGPIGGPAGRRNRELVRTLRALLRVPPSPGGTDENGSATMSQPSAPALTGQDIGEAEESLPVAYSGEPLEIGFNADFLREGIESIDADELRLNLISPLRPAVMKGEGDDFSYLIMPIRLAG